MERLIRPLPVRPALLAALIAVMMVLLQTPPAQGTGASVGMIAVGGSPAYAHSCALTDTGQVKCWGGNDFGALGDGTTTDRSTPVAVSGLGASFAPIAVGAAFTCVREVGGGVKCWGANNSGELGDGTFGNSATPVSVLGLPTGVVSIVAGEDHACALTAAGQVKCWGANGSGQLGDGTTTNSGTPVGVAGLGSGVVDIAAGSDHTCALLTSGALKCWGDNSFGQIGDGTTTNRSTPTNVLGLAGQPLSMDGGREHTCAIIDSGRVQCWGRNQFGQLGDSTTSDRLSPASVCADHTCGSPLPNVQVVTAGDTHTCFVTSAHGVKCTGHNWAGQLGDGSTIDKDTPFNVVGLAAGVSTIASGGDHTCALLVSGAVKCWGRNVQGQLGDGSTANRSTPVDVVGLGPKAGIGDVNCNGQTNSVDAALVLQFSAGLVITLPCFPSGDVDNNGVVNAVDAAIILQYDAGLIGFII